MTKKATASIDPTCIELVRAGLITYRQLNEVHRLVQETGGSFEDVLVSKGYVSKAELAKRARPKAPSRKKTLRLTYSLDLVKSGLLTFKQLNECHREARSSKGEKNVVDVMLAKGYVTDVQLATIPKASERQKHKKFSSSWDLFRSGAVTLKALNECHKYVKLDAPGKSLKEALVERGYISRDQLAEIEKKKAAGELEERGPIRSPFMEKYAKELAEIPADLAEHLRREHLESEGISPEADEAESKLAEGDLDAAVAAAKTFLGSEGEDGDAAAKTFMDFAGDEDESPKKDDTVVGTRVSKKEPVSEEEAELRAARTMMGGDEEEDLQSARTMIGGDEDEDEGEDAELRAAKTMLGDADDEDEESSEDTELRAAKTMLGDDEEEGGDAEASEFRAAQTFIGGETDEEPKDGGASDPDLRAARTFVDMAEDEGSAEAPSDTESSAELRGAKTFMDMGGEGEEQPADTSELRAARTFMDVGDEPKQAAKKATDSKPNLGAAPVGGSTFMDMDMESGGGGGMFGSSETASGIAGPGMMLEKGDATKSGFQRQDTQTGAEGEGATFMDLDGSPGQKTKSAALREAFDRASKSGASGVKSGTEFDAGKSGSGTNVGTQSGASGSSVGTGSKSGESHTGTGSSSGTGSGTGSKGATSTAAGSQPSAPSSTEAEGDAKAKKKKKKEEEDAYSHPLVGKIIGGCRIVKKLGEGGMGAVFLAENQKLKRKSVIKVVPAHLSSNKQLIRRFEREAQAAAVVQHPNIVAVYNVGEENGVHYIEMEYVDGSALDGILKEKKFLDQAECLRIIKDACRGLAEAHKNGVIHRDIKPDNIMFTRKGQVKIADFGLARTQSEDLELTKVGQILGTPAYMSPEQCQGKPTDLRADIYSLGATFYCMITGKRPFTGASVMEIMQKHIDEEPISPREYNPEISVQVVKIILKMMAKKPDDRFQNAEDVIAAIEQFMKEEGTEHLLEIQKAIGDEWKIVKKLGQGGMGAVYSARSQRDKERVKKDELVAIKVLNREVSKEDVNRFELEAKLALEIDHENIIRVLEYKISEAVNYIVMEFVDGKSVRDIIRDQKKLDTKEAARIVREAAKGLGRAHQLGIIHRDIKPDNIMIANKTGAVKVADFGIAKHQSAQSELTQAGVVVGTPHYMSPEQCAGASQGVTITTQADIYSLGATLYFMVTGQKPFEGDTQMAIILQHLNQPPKPPREVDSSISESFSNVVLNMMAKKPVYRYATVDAAVKDLDAAEKGAKVKKRRKVDVSFEEQGAGKKLILAAAGFSVLLLALVLSITMRGDPQQRARAEMQTAVAAAETELNGLIAKKHFGEVDAAVGRAEDRIRGYDSTTGKTLSAEFIQSVENLRARAKDKKKLRDADADAVQKRIEDAWKRARGEVETARAIPVEDGDGFCTAAEHYIRTYGDAFAPTLEADEGTYGDSTVVKLAADAQRDMKSEVNRAGRERLEKLKEYVRSALEPRLYYHVAQARVGRLQQTFLQIPVTGHPKQPVELDVSQEMAQALQEYTDLEKRSLPTQDLITFRNACYNAEQTETQEDDRAAAEAKAQGKPSLPNYTRIIAAFEEAKRTIEKGSQADQARSMHARLVRERLGELTKIRDDRALKFVEDALKQAVEQLAHDGKLGKAVSALALLDKTDSDVRQSYDPGDPALKGHLTRLDQGRRQVLKVAAQNWRETRDEIDRLAWHDRRFLKAESALLAVMKDPEAQVEIALAGEPKTVRQLAQDELDALKPQLELLRADSDGGKMVHVPDQGPVLIGTDDDHFKNQNPRHPARVGSFWIDKTEVTVGQYLRFLRTDLRKESDHKGRTLEDVPTDKIGELCVLCRPHDPVDGICAADEPRLPNGHMPSIKIFEENPQKPIAFVSWFDAVAFAHWAGKKLPNEAEWEKAACWDPTLKKERAYPWGDEFSATLLVCSGPDDQWPDLPAAGSKAAGASAYGALDMAGSLWEWTADFYQPYDAKLAWVDPDFGVKYRVVRGGSFQDSRDTAFRGCYRFRAEPNERKAHIGFRCVREDER